MWRMTALDGSTRYIHVHIMKFGKETEEWSNYLEVGGPNESSAIGIVEKCSYFS